MSVSVNFNLKRLEKKLSQIEKVFLKDAAEQSLKSFGFESRNTLADAMREKYQHATNYTLKSPRFEHRGSRLTIFINDDQSQNQSAAKYLAPSDRTGGRRRKPIQPTTLSGVLRKFGTSKIAAPVPGSRAGRQFVAANGNLKGKKVQSLISQLTSPNPGAREQYFVIADRRGGLGPGIWRRYRVKNAVSLAFALLDKKPQVETQIDFHGVIMKAAEERLPKLIQSKLSKLLAQ